MMTDPRIEIVARALCKTHGVSGATWERWKHDAEAAISALDAHERKTHGWRTMESARPGIGPVLIWRPHADRAIMSWHFVGHRTETGWYDDEEGTNPPFEPTHWRPCPDPPL